MKFFLSPFILVIVCNTIAFCQCPQSGLKIQSATCEIPNNLKIDAVTCSTLKVGWRGSQNQSYKIRAIGVDLRNNNRYEIDTRDYSFENNDNYQAIIPVKTGSTVNLSVQGICTEGEARFYSSEQNVKSVQIPFCNDLTNIMPKVLRAYPNPTNNYITIDYGGKVTASTTFTIIDMNGKKACTVKGNTVNRIGTGYRLDLHNLITGTYLLVISNGKENSQVKFELIRN